MKALINPNQNNLVVDISATAFEVAPPLYWVDCDESINSYEFTYDGNSFISYVPPPRPTPPASTKEELMAKLLEIQTQLEKM